MTLGWCCRECDKANIRGQMGPHEVRMTPEALCLDTIHGGSYSARYCRVPDFSTGEIPIEYQGRIKTMAKRSKKQKLRDARTKQGVKTNVGDPTHPSSPAYKK